MSFLFYILSAFLYFHILIIIIIPIGIELTFSKKDAKSKNPKLVGVDKLFWVYAISLLGFVFFEASTTFLISFIVSFLLAHKAFFTSLEIYKDAYEFLRDSIKKKRA
jgi:hypothetical protein